MTLRGQIGRPIRFSEAILRAKQFKCFGSHVPDWLICVWDAPRRGATTSGQSRAFEGADDVAADGRQMEEVTTRAAASGLIQ